MGTGLMPIRWRPLVDPAACGVRLGVQLRAAAEQLAWSQGLCLSHWIKRLVEDFIINANGDVGADLPARRDGEIENESSHAPIAPITSRGSSGFNGEPEIQEIKSRRRDPCNPRLTPHTRQKSRR
jgi:hypothetical protein